MILCLIPARTHSKGIPNKNFRPLHGVSPFWRAMTIAQQFLELGEGGLVFPVLDADCPLSWRPSQCRPPSLATDEALMVDVVKWTLAQEPRGDPVVLLQPTQPLRTLDHVRRALDLLAVSGADSVVTLVQMPAAYAPDRACQILDNGSMGPFLHSGTTGQLDGSEGTWAGNRQEAEVAYVRDGTVYAFWRQTLDTYDNIYGADCRALVIAPEESCALDTEADWAEAERRLAAAR